MPTGRVLLTLLTLGLGLILLTGISWLLRYVVYLFVCTTS